MTKMPPLNDTNPDIEKIQIALLQKAGVTGRIKLMRSLSRTVTHLSYRAIARANPEFSPEEVELTFVGLHYGKDIAMKLKIYLEKNTS